IEIKAGQGRIDNAGSVEGALAELRAAGGNEYALAINNTGVVRATGYSTAGGRVTLQAGGAVSNAGKVTATRSVRVKSSAAVVNSGQVQAGDGKTGGTIVFESPDITIKAGSLLDVSAALGGGRIAVGGGAHGSGVDFAGETVDITQNAQSVCRSGDHLGRWVHRICRRDSRHQRGRQGWPGRSVGQRQPDHHRPCRHARGGGVWLGAV
ncbi:MAG: hypothetical protein EBU97_06605, partial [Rhodobacteraceae bacterium]|nr:hypothetical protein [Paracoccaceae bacterium]